MRGAHRRRSKGFVPSIVAGVLLLLAASATEAGPIAITSDDQFIWVVNPNNNSVSVHRVGSDANVKVREIRVGVEPHCVAVTPDNSKVYVTNTVSGTVSLINT